MPTLKGAASAVCVNSMIANPTRSSKGAVETVAYIKLFNSVDKLQMCSSRRFVPWRPRHRLHINTPAKIPFGRAHLLAALLFHIRVTCLVGLLAGAPEFQT